MSSCVKLFLCAHVFPNMTSCRTQKCVKMSVVLKGMNLILLNFPCKWRTRIRMILSSCFAWSFEYICAAPKLLFFGLFHSSCSFQSSMALIWIWHICNPNDPSSPGWSVHKRVCSDLSFLSSEQSSADLLSLRPGSQLRVNSPTEKLQHLLPLPLLLSCGNWAPWSVLIVHDSDQWQKAPGVPNGQDEKAVEWKAKMCTPHC